MMLLYFSCLSSWGSRLPVTAVTIFSEPGGVMERKRFPASLASQIRAWKIGN